jgi:hypothetical protein
LTQLLNNAEEEEEEQAAEGSADTTAATKSGRMRSVVEGCRARVSLGTGITGYFLLFVALYAELTRGKGKQARFMQEPALKTFDNRQYRQTF